MSLQCSKIKLLDEHFNSVLFSSGKPRAFFHNGLSMTLSCKSFHSLFFFVLFCIFFFGGGGERAWAKSASWNQTVPLSTKVIVLSRLYQSFPSVKFSSPPHFDDS